MLWVFLVHVWFSVLFIYFFCLFVCFTSNQAMARKYETAVKRVIYTNHHNAPYIRRHTCTHTQLPVAHNHSIKQGAVSMGDAAEVPLVQCAEITAGCRQTQPEILPLLLLKKVCTPASCKPQHTSLSLSLFLLLPLL